MKNKKFDIVKLGRWSIYFFLIGVVAGFGSILFTYMCEIGTHFFLDSLSGYRPALPAGEFHLFKPTSTSFNKWILLILPAFGGLISGWLVYTFAEEAEGHGTDAAIDAYHNRSGKIRTRVPIVKIIASSITLTTGGSGGREGPIAQIGAGFGSYLATKLKLSDRECRIMMAAGVGAGVGSIFRAPLAGALFASEVLYRSMEFESEIIIPAGVSSVVAYCIYCLVFGWESLFNSPLFKFDNPLELGPYIFLSIILVFVSMFYVKLFYSVINFFKKLKKVPNYVKPAIGGFLTGIIGFYLCDTLAFSYGFIQKAIYGEISVLLLLTVAIGKIFTTSFSIGSGGSGGVFGPSIVIGGAIGGAVGKIFNIFMPSFIGNSGSFVIVGMAGFFTAVSNTPISTIIFVSEMTNSYHLLLPSLLVCSITYSMSKNWSIFHKQVNSRINSPAHEGEFFLDVLESIRVKNIMSKVKKVNLISQKMSFSELKLYLANTSQYYFPLLDANKCMVGIFSINDIRHILFEANLESLVIAYDIGTRNVITVDPEEKLNSVLQKFTIKNIDSLPVVAASNNKKVIGMIERKEITELYDQQMKKMKYNKGNN